MKVPSAHGGPVFVYFSDDPNKKDTLWLLASVRPDGKLKRLAATAEKDIAHLLTHLLNIGAETEPNTMENANALYD